MEAASALSLSTLIMVVASCYHFDRITIISALFSVYFYKMVANNYREVQLKYYDTLEREEIETDGDRSRDTIKEATNVVDADDEDADDEDDEDYDDMPPLIPYKEDSQENRVLEQLHKVERETRQRNAERAMAAVISHLDAADEILGENRMHLD
jgi:hypothetical protein